MYFWPAKSKTEIRKLDLQDQGQKSEPESAWAPTSFHPAAPGTRCLEISWIWNQ